MPDISKYYLAICKLENIKPVPIKYGKVNGLGAMLVSNKITNKPLYMMFDKSKLNDIEFALYHEMAHQICLEKYNYLGHGSKFIKVRNYLNDKYMYSKLAEKYLYENNISLVNILKEDKVHVGYPEIIYYDDNLNVLGYITYEEYEGVPDIKFIEVSKDHRGKGIAYKMLKALQNQYPNEGIDFGYLTGDGAKLYKSLKFKTIKNPKYNKIKKQIELAKKKQDAEVKNNFANGDLWNDLDFKIYDLEQELQDTWEIKKILL